MYGRSTWPALTGAQNTLSVFTARKHAPSLRATFTACMAGLHGRHSRVLRTHYLCSRPVNMPHLYGPHSPPIITGTMYRA